MNMINARGKSVRIFGKWLCRNRIAVSLCLMCSVSVVLGNNPENDGVEIKTESGMLRLTPVENNAIRVRFLQTDSKMPDELVFSELDRKVKYKTEDKGVSIVMTLPDISVEYDKKSEALAFKDKSGRIILEEVPGGRMMKQSAVGEVNYMVEQHFVSPKDEFLFGTGQFQDGYLNVRGLSRRLTQVNTQIAVPFVLSSRGYGLLWHNYGLTDFNPASEQVCLRPDGEDGQTVTVDVTSTTGNKREVREVNAFTADIMIEEDGNYALLLDVGQEMARKYHLTIDGRNLLDINNLWLPPTTSLIVELKKGQHKIKVQGDKNDKPVLYWRKVNDETVFRSPVAQIMDYTVFAGNADEVIGSYRKLTGGTPLMPVWALGYIHCRERYKSQEELLENAKEFRKRSIPIDLIVQDWQYWGRHGWNAMRFDETNYPDPAEMVRELHGMDMRLMLSVWSKVDRKSELGREINDKGYYIPGTEWIDFFNPDAASFYWRNFSDRLVKPYQIDAWWLDATEPENDDLTGRMICNGTVAGDVYRNVYPMFVNKTVYEGLRKEEADKRVMLFTRSAFSGMQRYATATWTGDVGHDWETLRRQIVGGLGLMATGLPWWTYDAGGFFRPQNQYTDTAYHECFLRWLQASVFFPLMRVHGYMSQTEPWRYGNEVETVSKKYIGLRYSLLPYIYSCAADVTFKGYTIMRPLVMDFSNDCLALAQDGQFMFGPSFLVTPVTAPSVNTWPVYLPVNEGGWFDFWTGIKYNGGQKVNVKAGLSQMPLFVRGGSIIPMDFGKQYTTEKTDKPVEIRIYKGADAVMDWYEDEGDNYGYENGSYAVIPLKWDDSRNVLEIGKRKGSFPGMEKVKHLNVVLVSNETGAGDGASQSCKEIMYEGKTIKVKF